MFNSEVLRVLQLIRDLNSKGDGGFIITDESHSVNG